MRQVSVACWIVALVVGGVAVGCERGDATQSASEESPDTGGKVHPARRAARAFLTAVQYRDVQGAWKRHLESTRGGVYCRSDAFQKILERTRNEKSKRDCEDVRSYGLEERAALQDDAEFLVQVLRFVCEQPDGDCIDYARRVFETQVPQSEFWSRLESFDIRKVRVEDETADIYVDYWSGARGETEIHRRTLHLTRRGESWYVTDGFGSDRPKPRAPRPEGEQ